MNIRYLLGLLLLFSSFIVETEAQTSKINLKIIEKDTQLPVVAATIIYGGSKDDIDKQKNFCMTDSRGFASLTINSEKWCYYSVSMLGYISKTGRLKLGKKNYTISLSEDVMMLNQVVVTSTRAPKPIKLSPVMTQVVSAKALVDAGYSNLQQALQQETPGMNIQKVGFGSEISMQGLDARHILFLIDGERLTGEMAGNLDYERFNLHAIDRVEIVKGASSTLYGSRASGAVINLITKKTKRPFTINAGMRWGEMNERNYPNPSKKDFLYMYEKHVDMPNIQYWVSSGFNLGKFTSQTDVWYSSVDAFYLYQKANDIKIYRAANNDFLDEDVVIRSPRKHAPMGIEGNQHITASQKFYWNPNENWEFVLKGSMFKMNTFDMVQDLYFSQASDLTGTAKITYKIKDVISITANYHTDFYNRYKRLERRDYRMKVYDSHIIQPKLTFRSNYFKAHDLIAGFEYFQDDLTSDRFVNQKMTTRGLNELEYFIQDDYKLNDKWIISAGVRSNYSKQFGFMATPKLASKLSLNENLSFRFNYSMGYRSPSIKELFFNWDHLGMFQIRGNEDIQPEKNHYAAISSEYSDSSFFLSSTVYVNEFIDKIEGVWKIYDMQYNFEYMNLEHQTLYGLEFLGRYHFLENYLLTASYSYVHVSDLRGVKVNTTSPHSANIGCSYRYRSKKYSLDLSFSASIMGDKTFHVQDRLVQENYKWSRNAYFECSLPAYALCNINLNQTFFNKYKLSIGVDNLFNYTPETLGSGVTMFNIPATPGRRFHVQLEVNIDDITQFFK